MKQDIKKNAFNKINLIKQPLQIFFLLSQLFFCAHCDNFYISRIFIKNMNKNLKT